MTKINYQPFIFWGCVSIFMAALLVNRIHNGFGSYLDFGLFHLTFDKMSSNYEFTRSIFGHFQPLLMLFSLVDLNLPWAWQAVFPVLILFFLNPLLILSSFGKVGIFVYFFVPITWFVFLDIFVLEIFIFPIVVLAILYFDRAKIWIFLSLLVIGLLLKESFLFVVITFLLISCVKCQWHLVKAVSWVILGYVITYSMVIFAVESGVEYTSLYSQLALSSGVRFENWDWVEVCKSAIIFMIPFIFMRKNWSYFIISIFPFIIFSVVFDRPHLLYYSNQYLFIFLPFFIRDLVIIIGQGAFEKYSVMVFLLVMTFTFGSSPTSRLFFSDKIEKFNYRSYFPGDSSKIAELNSAFGCLSQLDGRFSIQNNAFWPIQGLKYDFLLFPAGVDSSVVTPVFSKTRIDYASVRADGVILRLDGDLFMGDQSCGFFYGTCSDEMAKQRFFEQRSFVANRSVGAIPVAGYEFYFFDRHIYSRYLQCLER